MQISVGILTGYIVFVGGYITTQILTRFVDGTGFYIENLILNLPKYFASGLIPALICVFMVPLIFSLTKLNLSLKDRLYYPTTIGISILCWIIVVTNWFLFVS